MRLSVLNGGNDVYRQRVYRRFRDFSKLTEKKVFFNPKERDERKKTRALLVTLTYDTKLCSFSDAWRNIGVEFNRYMSYLRKKFGKISSCRVFEAFENGHSHIHAILLFEETEFEVFRDKNGYFRVNEKDNIAKGWHSYVDVEAISSVGKGLRYLKNIFLRALITKIKIPKP